MVEIQKEVGDNLLLWDTYTVHQIYDTQTDEDQYFSSLNPVWVFCIIQFSAPALLERQSTLVDCAMHIQMRPSTYDP